ncbi:MAG: guanosine-3',5'-bis(diphosphate) 3'-pyrophosphohydrolase, partial [Betaproteobacteria bacterium TMED156]
MAVNSAISFSSLLKKVSYLSRSEKSGLKRAFEFCHTAHIGQFRKTGEPYFTHPLAVADICADWQLDSEALTAALLHDTVEDTNISLNQISNKFGGVVTELVDGLSKIDQLVFKNYEEAAAANFRKMLLATAADIRVILIKLADRLHNMRTLDALSKDQKKRISKET